ncbi:hypothetical protein BDR26DRAFT_858168 [Obelidium mucronatum]|nr:hypothetical protein BDR26DRAFT_858168 [Obelidium mucronatum]
MPSSSPVESKKNALGWFKSAMHSLLPQAGSASAEQPPPGEPQQQHTLGRKSSASFFGLRAPSRQGSASLGRSAPPPPPSPSPPAAPPERSRSRAESPWGFARDKDTKDRSPSRDANLPSRPGTLNRMLRSSSPAPSASSTLAAERLVRLTDAQLAELAAQVSAEAYRRRTPIGALLATYERASQSAQMRTKAPTTAARIAIMTNEKFKVFAADLDTEAARRDIPGIDIFGTKGASTGGGGGGTLGRSDTVKSQTRLAADATTVVNAPITTSSTTIPNSSLSAANDDQHSTPPPSPTAVQASMTQDSTVSSNLPVKLVPIVAAAASTAAAANANTDTTPPQTPNNNTNSTSSTSATTLSSSSTLPRSASATSLKDSEMTPEDHAVAHERMINLSDDEFKALVRDLKAELSARDEAAGKRRRRRGGAALEEGAEFDAAAAENAEDDDVELETTRTGRSTSIGNDGTASSSSSSSSAVSSNGITARTSSSPMRGAPGITQRRLIPTSSATTTSSLSTVTASGPEKMTVMQSERVALLKVITSVDLQDLWTAVEAEVNRREGMGIVIMAALNAPPAPVPTPTPIVAAAALPAAPAAEEVEVKPRRKLPGAEKEVVVPPSPVDRDESSSSSSSTSEPANVIAWRTRISKLSNEQLTEVTADVFDEITRRKEKSEPFLPPREDLSQKRNEARKELSKLPSKELRTLWNIIHDNMTKRNML